MADVRPPPPGAEVDYQLGGAYRLPEGVRVVVRDRTDPPARSGYSICYVNAYQTQPGTLRWWRRHHPRLLLRDILGVLVHDRDGGPRCCSTPRRRTVDVSSPGWSGGGSTAAPSRATGRWSRTTSTRSRARGLLTRADALAVARLLAVRAHSAGLAIAQKNLASVSRTERLQIGFDFAGAEECEVWRECDRYARAYGQHVIETEYTDNGRRGTAPPVRELRNAGP
jgi:hypothetical protein